MPPLPLQGRWIRALALWVLGPQESHTFIHSFRHLTNIPQTQGGHEPRQPRTQPEPGATGQPSRAHVLDVKEPVSHGS